MAACIIMKTTYLSLQDIDTKRLGQVPQFIIKGDHLIALLQKRGHGWVSGHLRDPQKFDHEPN